MDEGLETEQTLDLFKRIQVGPLAFSLFQILVLAMLAIAIWLLWDSANQMAACSNALSTFNASFCRTCDVLKDLGVLR